MRKKTTVPFQGEIGESDVISIINSMKNVANGIAGLNSAGQLNLAQIPLLPASQLGFGFAWENAGSVSTAGVSSISFSNLTGDTDKLYLLIVLASNSGTAALGDVCIRFNGDLTGGNYEYVYAYVDSAGTLGSGSQNFGGTSNRAYIPPTGLPGSAFAWAWCYIVAEGIPLGTKSYVPVVCCGGQSTGYVTITAGGWLKSAEITSIEVTTAAGTAVSNWLVYLFKPKW